MGSLSDFAKSMRRTAQAVGENAIDGVKKVSMAAGVAVVYATPVDTSRARMNWQGSVDQPIEGVLRQYPDKPDSPKDGPQVAIESIKRATEAYDGQTNGVFIVNNLDYIQALNDGSSSQAPANFVAQAVLAGVDAVKTVKLLP